MIDGAPDTIHAERIDMTSDAREPVKLETLATNAPARLAFMTKPFARLATSIRNEIGAINNIRDKTLANADEQINACV